MNAELRAAVRALFSAGKVKSVLGYREHPLTGAVVPALITCADEAEQLIFDDRCVQNLVRGLSPGTPAPVGVLLKGCDGRALNMLITEGTLKRENVVAIAVACPGVKEEGKVAERCLRCEVHVSPLADVVVGDVSALPKPEVTRAQAIARIKAMTPAERFEYWQKAFSACTRCYACREVCPLCNCDVCVTDQNAPRWIEQSTKPSSNMMWHMIRAFHHTGRCVDCSECARACPEDVPMHLLDLCLAEDVEELFDFKTGMKTGGKWPFLMFDPEDPDSWLGGPHRG